MAYRLVFTTLAVFVIGYYFYIPIPPDAAEPWKLHISAVVLRIVDDVSTIANLLGFSRVNATRATFHAVLHATKYLQPDLDRVKSTEDSFDGIKVRIYRPQVSTNKLLPGVVYIHGGGWTLFNIDIYDPFTRALANKTDAVVVSVDYRMAPEHIFPAAFEDCVKATLFFLQNAAKFGVDATKIGVSGDSAGGNLAMAVSLYLGKENIQPKLNFQGLIYPALQALDYNLSSYQEFDMPMRTTYTLVTKICTIYYYNLYGFGGLQYSRYFYNNSHTTRETKKKYRKHVDPGTLPWQYKVDYNDENSSENEEIANKISQVILNPYFAPLMATDEELKLLPKTYLITAQYDGLRDEGMILGNRLRGVNHPLVYKHWDGVDHGFMIVSFYESYWAGLQHFSSYIKEMCK